MSETLKSFLAGWAGGVGILAVGHPFDTVKTIMQNAPRGTYTSAKHCVKDICKSEGLLALYKGVSAPLAGVGTVFALYFVAYDTTERLIRSVCDVDPVVELTMPQVMVAGGSTGIVGSLVLGPAELMKVQQQTAKQQGLDGSFSAVGRRLYAAGGIRAFTRGLGATMMRDIPGSMAWFGAYEFTKKTVCEDPMKPSVGQALVSGGMGGIGMWSFAIPLDAIKTRVQASQTPLSFFDCSKRIYTEMGIGGFYRGIGPALLRAFPANAACFACKEMAQQGLDKLM